jgi:hypothetical protein
MCFPTAATFPLIKTGERVSDVVSALTLNTIPPLYPFVVDALHNLNVVEVTFTFFVPHNTKSNPPPFPSLTSYPTIFPPFISKKNDSQVSAAILPHPLFPVIYH